MTFFSKQSEAWVTGSKPNQFRQDRLRLTFLYTAIFALFLGVFSLALYLSFSERLHADLGRSQTAAETIDRLQDSIKWVDLASIILVASASFSIAGLTLEPIRRAVGASERFMADASHELRTPLTVLQTGLEGFERKKNPSLDEARSLVASSLEEVRRMNRLVADLRTLARFDSTARPKPQQVTDFSAAVQKSVESLAEYARQRGIELQLSTVPATVLAEPHQLQQACSNLLKNAIDYSAGGNTVTATLTVGSEAVLEITDQGTGVAPADLPRVFDWFYRAEQSSSRKTGGSGLGLAIVKDIVEGAGGSVSLRSSLGHGTIASLRLPLTRRS